MQDSVDVKKFGLLDLFLVWIFGFLDFWIFGMLDFWMLVFWILRLVDICTPGPAFPCTVAARARELYHVYALCIYTCVNWLNQAVAVPEEYLANRKMAHCLVPVLIKMMMIVKANYCALLGTRTNSNNDNKSTGAHMDIQRYY